MKIVAAATAQVPSTTANSIQVMKVCQALAQLGHELTLLVPERAGSTAAEQDWAALSELYGLSTRFELQRLPCDPRWQRNDFAWNAARRAAAEKADLVYTWAIQTAVLARAGGLPVLYEAHDLPTGRVGPLWTRVFLRQPGKKRLVMITRALRRALERRFGRLLREDDLVIAPNGLELERYTGLPPASKARRWLNLPDGLTVGCFGHLYAGRGGELFLQLAAAFPGLRFLWVGGRDEDVAAYRGRAAAEGLQNTAFAGFIPNANLPLYQAACDVLLMPYGRAIAGSGGGDSAAIASPMKLFDYLGAGRAILTSNLPVIREVLDENSALFAPPDDPAAWGAALNRLAADDALRMRLGEKARELAARYTWLEREKQCLEGL